MPCDPIWRNHDDLLDATPAVLHEEVLGDAERWSDRVALLDAATGRSLAYGELVAQARRFAAGLRGRGAAGGDVLALVAGNTPEYAVVAHGTLSAGLTLAPASPLLTARELGAFLRQTGARYALADVAALPKVTEAATAAGVDEVFALDSLPAGDPLEPRAGEPQSIAVLLSTSGTTGLPKSAAHTHIGAVASLRQFACSPPRRFEHDDVVRESCPSRTCSDR